MQFIDDIKNQWKAWSTWIAGAAIVFNAAYVFAQSMQSMLTPDQFAAVNAVLLFLIKVANIVKQNFIDEERK